MTLHENVSRRTPLLRIALAAGAVWCAACDPQTATTGATEEMLGLDGPVIYDMTSFLASNGIREGRVRADTAYSHEDSAVYDLRRMTVDFFDENGRDKATVVGDYGQWNQLNDRLFARGAVVLDIHTDGSRIESSELNYDPESDRIWSDSATVRTLANGRVTEGSSFESDIDFQNVILRNPRGAIGR